MLTKEQIEYIKELGIDTDHLTESESIDELLKTAHLLALSAEFTEKDFLKREIARALKPSN
mgnify:FL=1